MIKKGFDSIFFQPDFAKDLFTGHGFKIRIGFGYYGLLFRIYWGPYEKSRLLIIFVGIDRGKLMEWRIKRLMRKTTPAQRAAIEKVLLEVEKG